MRGLTLLLASTLTLTYGFVAQAAIGADLAETTRRAAQFAPPDTTGVLDAGTLAPIVVEAPLPSRSEVAPSGQRGVAVVPARRSA